MTQRSEDHGGGQPATGTEQEISERAAGLAEGVLAGNRTRLAQAITLIESTRSADAPVAQELLGAVLPKTGRAHRVGISGVPGVGKSTLIETLGLHLIEAGHRVAVLAIDPSSTLSGGSILGDKSRMERLAQAEAAFIRPSPSAATLGGVAQRTRETMLLCEAAGFDVVLVETVGVGQSEIAVREMVDTFVVLLLPGAGDELQGIKKGILEVGDILAVNKADGSRVNLARAAARDHSAAMRYIRPRHPEWTPKTLVVSAETGAGIDELWAAIGEHRAMLEASGSLGTQRAEQSTRWMWSLIEERLFRAFRENPAVAQELGATVDAVRAGSLPPGAAATRLLNLFGSP
ncbi:methylmalonyl Co-A mutase-associated GTPase MeaB [Planctomycetes bacterium Poly30]